MSNVTSLGMFANNGGMLLPVDQLKHAIEVIEDGTIEPDKILILALDNKDGDYDMSWLQANMKMSECLALCEVAKTYFLKEMRFIPDE